MRGSRAGGTIPNGLVARSGSAGHIAIVPPRRASHADAEAAELAEPCACHSPRRTNSMVASERTSRTALRSLRRTRRVRMGVEVRERPS